MVVIIELLWHLTGVSVEQLQTPVFEHPFTVHDGKVVESFDNKSFETEWIRSWFQEMDILTIVGTVKPVYNDHLMGYFSAFWGSSRWPRAT